MKYLFPILTLIFRIFMKNLWQILGKHGAFYEFVISHFFLFRLCWNKSFFSFPIEKESITKPLNARDIREWERDPKFQEIAQVRKKFSEIAPKWKNAEKASSAKF